MKELHEQTVLLMESIFNKCDPKLKGFAYVRPEDLRISIPAPLMSVFIDGLNKIYGLGDQLAAEKRNYYRGIEIIPNYEMSIVLFHIEYPKTKELWMIHKVWLEAPKIQDIPLPDISGIS